LIRYYPLNPLDPCSFSTIESDFGYSLNGQLNTDGTDGTDLDGFIFSQNYILFFKNYLIRYYLLNPLDPCSFSTIECDFGYSLEGQLNTDLTDGTDLDGFIFS